MGNAYQLTLEQTQEMLASLYNNRIPYQIQPITAAEITPELLSNEEWLKAVTGDAIRPVKNLNGETIAYNAYNIGQASTTSAVNSNVSTIARGTLSNPVSTTVNNAGKVVATKLSGVGTKVVTAATKLAVPLTLASIGISLGKTIDETLYNANPDFWENIGAGTINPQTWSSIAGGDDTFGGQFINALFGIDPQTGESQAYIDANAMAYLAYCMQQAGVFNVGGTELDPTEATGMGLVSPISYLTIPIDNYISAKNDYVSALGVLGSREQQGQTMYYFLRSPTPKTVKMATFHYNGSAYFVSLDSCDVKCYSEPNSGRSIVSASLMGYSYTYDSRTAQYYSASISDVNNYVIDTCAQGNSSPGKIGWALQYGTFISQDPIQGIGTQTGATVPDLSGLAENEVLPYLQQTYPDMFTNAINYPVAQPDGTVKNYTYVPITLPQTSNPADTQPISGDQTQAQPAIDPATATQILNDLLNKVLQEPLTQPISDNPTPPSNPVDTGDGSTPQITAPTGSASSLWAIYHPSQSEVDSFGAWLWSSNFIDQILKIFNNPMDAIIGLHKIYATPVDAGTTTIKVGYLDSQVSSSYITQQYIEIDCGTVNLGEQFGNVFDYSPYTDVQLYLPFVGIVPLNVADVMRSSISITYGVDVITGACLAMVTVSRDANNAVLYQYSGNCAVQYPVSSGSYMGIVSSIIGVAGGIAATAATGGGAAPIVMGAAGAAFNAHTSIQRSGSFSGNSGAMGGKIPYLIITRPQTKTADNFDIMQGYPTNAYTTVGSCQGYIKAIAAHVINVNATDDELTLINDYLLSGIII